MASRTWGSWHKGSSVVLSSWRLGLQPICLAHLAVLALTDAVTHSEDLLEWEGSLGVSRRYVCANSNSESPSASDLNACPLEWANVLDRAVVIPTPHAVCLLLSQSVGVGSWSVRLSDAGDHHGHVAGC